jgi:hypothetical protein
MNSWQYRYDTGWINRSDWTNVHLGSNTTKNTDSNVTHNLNAPLSNLLVKVFASTDGTDANSLEVKGEAYDDGNTYGWTVFEIDSNSIKIQTGDHGLLYIQDNGVAWGIATEDWYYKVKVFYLG